MKSLASLSLRLAVAVAVCLLTAALSHAAIPNLSLVQLREDSTLIVTGTVTNVRVERIAVNFGGESHIDYRHLLTLRVSSVEKGEAPQTVTVETWTPGSRPNGFAGPQGQSFIPAKGDKARFYCRNENGRLKILEPNGILKIGGGKKDKGKP